MPWAGSAFSTKPRAYGWRVQTTPTARWSEYRYHDEQHDRRLQSIRHLDATGGVLSAFAHTYDELGRMATWHQQQGSDRDIRYALGYDRADRLIEAVVRDAGLSITNAFAYAYDRAGNRIREQVGARVTDAEHNALNQLLALKQGRSLQVSGMLDESGEVRAGNGPYQPTRGADHRFRVQAPVEVGTNTLVLGVRDVRGSRTNYAFRIDVPAAEERTLAYDANGNPLQRDGIRYEWDGGDRLVAIRISTFAIRYTYDGWGRWVRIQLEDAGRVFLDTRYVWCGNRVCEERIVLDEREFIRTRYYGKGHLVGAEPRYYTHDHLGSLREMTDASGRVLGRYAYDPYGRQHELVSMEVAPFGFTGHFNHQVARLYLAPYRFYDPELGRWMSRDPIAEDGGLNLYAYAYNSPLNYYDPYGLLNVVVGGDLHLVLLGGVEVSGGCDC